MTANMEYALHPREAMDMSANVLQDIQVGMHNISPSLLVALPIGIKNKAPEFDFIVIHLCNHTLSLK